MTRTPWLFRVGDVIRVRGRHFGYASLHRPPSWFICIRIRSQTTNQNAPFGQKGPTQLLFCSVKGRILKVLITSWVKVGANLVGANLLESKTSSYSNCIPTCLYNNGCISLTKSKLWHLNLTNFSRWKKLTAGISIPFAALLLLLPRQVPLPLRPMTKPLCFP